MRLKCEANIYTDPQQITDDLTRVINWQLLFRAHTIEHFAYFSQVHMQVMQLLLKKDLPRMFLSVKQ